MNEPFPASEGWKKWDYYAPQSYVGGDKYPIEVGRTSAAEIDSVWKMVIYARDLPPEANIVGWYWRPTGIFLHAVGSLRPLGGQQAYEQGLAQGCLSGLFGSSAGLGLGAYSGLSQENTYRDTALWPYPPNEYP